MDLEEKHMYTNYVWDEGMKTIDESNTSGLHEHRNHYSFSRDNFFLSKNQTNYLNKMLITNEIEINGFEIKNNRLFRLQFLLVQLIKYDIYLFYLFI